MFDSVTLVSRLDSILMGRLNPQALFHKLFALYISEYLSSVLCASQFTALVEWGLGIRMNPNSIGGWEIPFL